MIEKMKFLSVIGHQDDIDRVIDQYLSRYEIQFENALSELKNVQGLRPFMASNPYREVYQKACELTASLGDVSSVPSRPLSPEEAAGIVNQCAVRLNRLSAAKAELEGQLESCRTSLDKISHFTELDYDLSAILHFRYIKFRFGRITREYYGAIRLVPPIAVSSLQNLPTRGFAVMPERPSDPPHLKPTMSFDIGTGSRLSAFIASAISARSFFPSATSSSDSWQTRNFTLSGSTGPRSSLKESIVLFSHPSPMTSTPPAFG